MTAEPGGNLAPGTEECTSLHEVRDWGHRLWPSTLDLEGDKCLLGLGQGRDRHSEPVCGVVDLGK